MASSSHWVEKGRFLNIQTALGDDKFLLRGFHGHEAISTLFGFDLDLLSEDPEIDFDSMIGANLTFSVRLADVATARCFNGYVSRFEQLPSEERLTRYRAEVVPWLWFLTRCSDCRIFQNMTVPDILNKVFRDLGFTDHEQQLRGSYKVREYCVQYRETHFNFVSRLMEEEGIYYFFKHENGKHTLVMADNSSAHQFCPDQRQVFFEREQGRGVAREEDVIYAWRMEQELRAGKYTLTDYNFETPTTDLQSNVDSQINQGGNNRFELYDYPGLYLKRGEGDSLTKVRIEEEEAAHLVVHGESDCRAFQTGFKFDLEGYERLDQNITYLLTSIDYAAQEGGFHSGSGSQDSTYSNNFSAIPATVTFRPTRLAPKPRIHGTQTAVIAGPSGEEIFCDKYGRVKVQFHWDRVGRQDERSSCWIRVAQTWAGKGWGSMVIPRIGQEVVVSFLEGDPDRPIITGVVYNATQMPPYPLPDRQVVSTMRSCSSKGGGNSNEIRLDDTKGKEEIYVHAAYDYNTLVDNDRRETITKNSHHRIKETQYERIKERHTKVDTDWNVKVGADLSLNVGSNRQEKVAQNYALDAGTEIHLKAGMNLVIESGTTLTLKVGGNFVNINSGGVFIKGSMVMINSGGAAGSGAGASPTAPKDPEEVQPGAGTQVAPPPPPPQPPKPQKFSPQATALSQAAQTGAPFCDH